MVDNKTKISSQKIQQPGVDSASKLCSCSMCALAIALCLATQQPLVQNVVKIVYTRLCTPRL